MASILSYTKAALDTLLGGKVPTTRTVNTKALSSDISLDADDVGALAESDVAGLDTVGWGRAVFIENGGTVPGGTPPYTIVIEAGA